MLCGVFSRENFDVSENRLKFFRSVFLLFFLPTVINCRLLSSVHFSLDLIEINFKMSNLLTITFHNNSSGIFYPDQVVSGETTKGNAANDIC